MRIPLQRLACSSSQLRAHLISPCTFSVALVLLWLCSHRSSALAAPLVGNTYVVNSTADLVDADQGDGTCAAANGACTLRAAIMQANFDPAPATIVVSSGLYTLTRPGVDNDAILGDLDIKKPVTIQGAGSAASIVDGNGAVTGDRAFDVRVIASQIVTITGLTIRHGRAQTATVDFDYGAGGGLYLGSGGLHLNDVVLDSNLAVNGGGLFTNFINSSGLLLLEHSVVRANQAITINVGSGGFGGGMYIAGDSGTIGDVRVENSEIYSNTAYGGAGIESSNIENGLTLDIVDSRLYDNHALAFGGGLEHGASLNLTRSTLDANTAGTLGGGLSVPGFSGMVPGTRDVVISIVDSTISRNVARDGGGIWYVTPNYTHTLMRLTNSTVSDNLVARDGGGIYADGAAVALSNVTIAGNRVVVPPNSTSAHTGAGVFVTGTASITFQNTLLGNNISRFPLDPPFEDDCFGLMYSSGYDLIQATTQCVLIGVGTGNIIGQDPKLGPLQNNGGSAQTQALLAGSPAIDAGSPGCKDLYNQPLTTDQRGWRRPIGAACDIGAFEYSPNVLELPLIMR